MTYNCWPVCGPRQARKYFQTCADSDHPAYAQSSIRAFPFHLYIMEYTMILLANSECPDQTARNAQADLGRRCPHTPEDKFSHDAVHIRIYFTISLLWHKTLYHGTYGHSCGWRSTHSKYTQGTLQLANGTPGMLVPNTRAVNNLLLRKERKIIKKTNFLSTFAVFAFQKNPSIFNTYYHFVVHSFIGDYSCLALLLEGIVFGP